MQSQTLLGIARHLRALAELIEADSADLLAACRPRQAIIATPDTAGTSAAVPNHIEGYLARRGVVLVTARPPEPSDLALLPLAQHIASTHPRCEPLIQAIKRTQGTARGLRLNLQDTPQEHIAAITALGAQAARAQLLPGYRYRKSPIRELSARPPRSPAAIAFFTGKWLEILVYDIASRLATSAGWEAMTGAIIRLPDGDRFEIDLFAAGPDGRAVILEAKTTDSFADELPKYRRLVKMLGIATDDALLVAPGLDDWSLIAAAMQAEMRPLRLHEIGTAIAERFGIAA